ncbi:MAG: type I restriction endonuclease subunit R [Psittacicella sp.]
MTKLTNPIAGTNNFIVLSEYNQNLQSTQHYQSESDLEKEFIKDLMSQGYEFKSIHNSNELLENLKICLESLNKINFTSDEWNRFLKEFLNSPNDTFIDKTRKLHDNYIYDFVFDNGHIQNIYLVDKKNIALNKVQVINQFTQKGTHSNRYDVTILINGLPLVQIELKKRGVAIQEAFNQIDRYKKESFNKSDSLYKYIQIFVISNGSDTRYFANTTKRDKSSFDFTMSWADFNNNPIKDLKDFTMTFFEKNTLLKILFNFSVFDISNTLLIMRPYQIAAAERILWKIKSSYNNKKWSSPESGGYIWHTTGSGKTLTSFKAARLATELNFIDKVFFIVDRKDLDFQTMKEYQRFSPDSVNGSNSTSELKKNLQKSDNKIIVTTIQKLNHLIKSELDLPIYQQQVVFIFDECHRSQFGEAQKNLTKRFKYYYQFGFTGTPIFLENSRDESLTTSSVFGAQIHSYVITDAIRDNKVLKFKVDYNNLRPQFKSIETEQNNEKIKTLELKENDAFMHPERISEISNYILEHYNYKTHRTQGKKGFNAMFAVSNINAAKAYYAKLNELQKERKSLHPLKIATIFSFTANEEQNSTGYIEDESFEPLKIEDLSAKEFLTSAIEDYNTNFKTNYTIDSAGFQNYYRDLSKRVKDQEIDLLIVVGMFLTGFDAPGLNTLFVDKNLRYHGLIQAYSRTNRIFNESKPFGNIVSFRDLEQATIDALKLFSNKDNKNNTSNIILEKSYDFYMHGKDSYTNETTLGFIEIISEIEKQFPNPKDIIKESDKVKFVELFSKYIKTENILRNYDEFTCLQEFQNIDINNFQQLESFKEKYCIDELKLTKFQNVKIPPQREIQNYLSTYLDISNEVKLAKNNSKIENGITNDIWDNITFEVELLKSQEINLDYILSLILESSKNGKERSIIIDYIKQIIRTSSENRPKEDLIILFINKTDLSQFTDNSSILEAFYKFAKNIQQQKLEELIENEKLNPELTRKYISSSLKQGYPDEFGMDLNNILPKMSPLNSKYKTQKQTIFQKISLFVNEFQGINNNLEK